MKIDNRMVNYEVNKNLAHSASKVFDNRPVSSEQQGSEINATQDTIVNLSRTSKEVQLMESAVRAEPDIRADKVEALKQRIESGNYQIDHEAVANKLVDRALEEIL